MHCFHQIDRRRFVFNRKFSCKCKRTKFYAESREHRNKKSDKSETNQFGVKCKVIEHRQIKGLW